jgi:uncharacterized protein YbjT (DUF2867 family)
MSSTPKTAVVIGATGLVGYQILDLLLNDSRYEKVKVFHRRSTGVEHPKLEEHVIKFDEMRIWKHMITGDELYSALGTTLKAAGSKEAQYVVDYDYQLDVAKEAAANGVKSYGLVSSQGASNASKVFYLNMKGKLDKNVQKLGFEKVVFVRPSILDGNRQESRQAEKVGIVAMKMLSHLPFLREYKPIHVRTVARALINGLNNPDSKTIYEGLELFELAGESR